MSAMSLSLRCPHCGAQPGIPCSTPSGAEPRGGNHVARWEDIRFAVKTREMVYRLKADDGRFGLQAGDELVCVKYPYDAKVTVLRRLSDGFDPGCNQYLADVEWIRWHEPAPAAHTQA